MRKFSLWEYCTAYFSQWEHWCLLSVKTLSLFSSEWVYLGQECPVMLGCRFANFEITVLQTFNNFFLSKEIRLKTDDIFEKYHRLFDKNKLLQNLKLLELYLKFFPKLFSIRNYDKKSKLFSRQRRTEVRIQNFRTQWVLSKLWRLKFSEWKICLLT